MNKRLGYCHSLHVGVDQSLLCFLQLVQNAAACLLTGKRKYNHITPILASLHWLPVRFLESVFKALSVLAPQYLAKLLHFHTPARALRSANQLLLEIPKTRLKTRGDLGFGAVAPRLWNSLAWHVRSAPTLQISAYF